MVQVLEKSETQTYNTKIEKWLIKGKDPAGRDFIRFSEITHNGLCIGYHEITVITNNLLRVSEYHHCQDFDPEEELEEEKGRRAYVEKSVDIDSIKTFKDFSEVYEILYECIKRQNGWGKTVKCD
jgi:hypothetical protein